MVFCCANESFEPRGTNIGSYPQPFPVMWREILPGMVPVNDRRRAPSQYDTTDVNEARLSLPSSLIRAPLPSVSNTKEE